MPLIELYSPDPGPDAQALRRLAEAVTDGLRPPAAEPCRLVWHRVAEAEECRPQWAPGRTSRAPVGFATCPPHWSAEQTAELLRLARAAVAELLAVPREEVCLAVRRAEPGEPPAADAPAADVPIAMRPIGTVVGGRGEVADDDWAGERAVIRLDPAAFGPESLYGLGSFSHLEVVYHFHRVPAERIESGARHPRGNSDWPLVGIFAQRGKNRPNRIGVSRCRLEAVEGLDILVEGLDAVDGTPVLDIKPYMAEFGPRGGIRQPQWATEIMRHYY